MKKAIQEQDNPLVAALKVAAAGNIVDAGALGLDIPIQEAVEAALAEPFGRDDSARLIEELTAAKSILVIGDNAGETVLTGCCWKLSRSSWGEKDVYYAVKSAPIINDATAEDAAAAGGLNKVATVLM